VIFCVPVLRLDLQARIMFAMELRRDAIPDLLNALDAAVIGGGASGFDGRVAIGVEVSPDRALWWVAELGPAPQTSFTPELPWNADAGAIFGSDQADAMVDGRPLAPERFATFGEIELLERVIARYLRLRSPLDVRAAATSERPSKKRARRKAR
jgi:hypothetical protein